MKTLPLALLALALAAAPHAHGASLFLCGSCEKKLRYCCPRPCPVVDTALIGAFAAQHERMQRVLESEHQQNASMRALAALIGTPGARNTVRPPPVDEDPLDSVPKPREAFRAILETPDAERNAREFVRQRASADAADAQLRLAAALDLAAERFAQSEAAINDTRDLRDLVRRIAELRLARAEIDAIAQAAVALNLSLRSAHQIPIEIAPDPHAQADS